MNKSHSKYSSDEEGRLVQENIGLVVQLAKSFNPPNYTELEEYIQLGRIGLLKAIRYFDSEKGTKLTTLAYFCIKQEIIKHLKKQQKYNKFKKDFIQYSEEQSKLHDNIPPNSYIPKDSFNSFLPDTLSDTEYQIITLRSKGYSLEEIGKMMGGRSRAWITSNINKISRKINESNKKTPSLIM